MEGREHITESRNLLHVVLVREESGEELQDPGE